MGHQNSSPNLGPQSLLGPFDTLSTVPKAKSQLTVCTDDSAGSVTSDAQTNLSAFERTSFRGVENLRQSQNECRLQKRMEGLENENSALLERVRELESLVTELLNDKQKKQQQTQIGQ